MNANASHPVCGDIVSLLDGDVATKATVLRLRDDGVADLVVDMDNPTSPPRIAPRRRHGEGPDRWLTLSERQALEDRRAELARQKALGTPLPGTMIWAYIDQSTNPDIVDVRPIRARVIGAHVDVQTFRAADDGSLAPPGEDERPLGKAHGLRHAPGSPASWSWSDELMPAPGPVDAPRRAKKLGDCSRCGRDGEAFTGLEATPLRLGTVTHADVGMPAPHYLCRSCGDAARAFLAGARLAEEPASTS